MNEISEQLLQAMDIIAEEKVSQLQFDKTIQATIYGVVNLDTGEYKVQYKGNIFSVFASDLTETYKVDDAVYVTVPQGNFSFKKFIIGLVSSKSLNQNQLTDLQNSIFEISPTFDLLYGGAYDREAPYGVIAGAPTESANGHAYIYEGPNEYSSNDYHGLFQQYASKYDLIRVQANFLTQFYDIHNKGNYGLELEFFAKDNEKDFSVVFFRLDLNSFNGDPYNLNVYSPQYVILKVQKNYLLGLKSIKLFEEDFEYDKLVKDGKVTDEENKENPNIFVKDIEVQFVEQKNLSDTAYYLTIAAPKGIAFSQNVSSSLDLVGRLIYQGKDIMSESKCQCQWFVRDLTVMIGDSNYDKTAGFGWRPLLETSSTLSLVPSDVFYQQKYKLLVTYNETVSLQAEIEIFNNKNKYSYKINQKTDNEDISLQIVNGDINDLDSNLSEEEKRKKVYLKGDWFLSYPDDSYFRIYSQEVIELREEKINKLREIYEDSSMTSDEKLKKIAEIEKEYADKINPKIKPLNEIIVSNYLRYSMVTFYCQVYDETETHIIGTAEYVIMNSNSDQDVIITYEGEDTFRYDANGDIAIEDSEKERTLQVNLTWREGYGTGYIVSWYMRNAAGEEILLTGRPLEKTDNSMIEKPWVDNYNILHYTIRQKYNINFNNNIVIVKIKTINDEEYSFQKEILFLKDGDQGTNGTTYVIAIRPCDVDGTKSSGFQPLVYKDNKWSNLSLKCYVYKDGELINNEKTYGIKYQWTGININFSETNLNTDRVTANSSVIKIDKNTKQKDLQFYVKAQVTINDNTNGREVIVYASYPIDIAVGDIDIKIVDISSIPSYIKYTSSGVTPSFYNNNIEFIYNKESKSENIKTVTPQLIDIKQKPENSGIYYLDAASSFIAETKEGESNIGILKCSLDDNNFIIHPIIMYLNTFGNEAINGWDGESVGINEEGGYILAPQIGAGIKNSDNTFTGVVMGHDTSQTQIGLYGYKGGINSFGLKADGTAFFGAKSGGGQIVIDGRHATIYGGDVKVNESSGKITPAANGMYIVLGNKDYSPPIEGEEINNNFSNKKAIGIGYGLPNIKPDESTTSKEEELFYVTYGGNLKATNANIHGNIYANYGRIGGKARDGGWVIETNRIYSGKTSSYVALDSTPINEQEENKTTYFAIWAGKEKPGTYYQPSSFDSAGELNGEKDNGIIGSPAPFVVTKDGFLYAENAKIKGHIVTNYIQANKQGQIAGWTLDRTKLISSGQSEDRKGQMGMASSGTYRFWSNASSYDEITGPSFNNNSYFWVNNRGELNAKGVTVRGTIYAEQGEIGDWYLRDGILQNSTGTVYLGPTAFKFGDYFTVDRGGNLTATNANITGIVNATGLFSNALVLRNPQDPDGSIMGMVGFIEGQRGGGMNDLGEYVPPQTTENFGIKTYDNISIVLESDENIRLGIQNFGTKGIFLEANAITLKTPAPENQIGIYARFA